MTDYLLGCQGNGRLEKKIVLELTQTQKQPGNSVLSLCCWGETEQEAPGALERSSVVPAASCVSTKPGSRRWNSANLLRMDETKSDVAEISGTHILRSPGG